MKIDSTPGEDLALPSPDESLIVGDWLLPGKRVPLYAGAKFTEDQMRAAIAAAVLAERRQCAKLIREMSEEAYSVVLVEHEEAARWLEAAAIRAGNQR